MLTQETPQASKTRKRDFAKNERNRFCRERESWFILLQLESIKALFNFADLSSLRNEH
jgi:hypothetical protein